MWTDVSPSWNRMTHSKEMSSTSGTVKSQIWSVTWTSNKTSTWSLQMRINSSVLMLSAWRRTSRCVTRSKSSSISRLWACKKITRESLECTSSFKMSAQTSPLFQMRKLPHQEWPGRMLSVQIRSNKWARRAGRWHLRTFVRQARAPSLKLNSSILGMFPRTLPSRPFNRTTSPLSREITELCMYVITVKKLL